MMSSISWKDFFTYISIALFCYYMIIGIIHYRNELLQLKERLLNQISNQPASQKDSIETHTTSKPIDATVSPEKLKLSSETDEHTLLNDLLEKLGLQIENAASKNFIKEELLVSIQLVLAKISNLQYSSFVSSIESYIQSHVENKCSIYLTDLEVSALWKK